VPLPLPLAPAVMVIQAALLTAVHEQPVVAVTATVAVPPPAAAVADVDPRVGLQAAAAWVTVKVLPATVRVPERELPVVLALPEYATDPLLVPLAPAVIEIQDALLTAVHAQPLPAVTATAPVNAADDTFADAGEMPGAHELAAWVTVNVVPAIVSVPVRDVDPVLAAPV